MGKCKDCKFWVDSEHKNLQQSGMKYCEGINFDNDYRMDDTQLFISVDEGVYHIETDAEFGCIAFEQK